MLTALLVIAILVFLIIIHELGHFIAAKIFGVRVDEFGLGYPPRAFLFGKIGETEYTFNWLPFGGFVKLFGEDGLPGQGGASRSLSGSSRLVQAIILVAGVTMNLVAAWALFTAAYSFGLPRVVDTPLAGEKIQLVVSEVVAGSPAEAAGIQAGDAVTQLVAEKDGTKAILTPVDVQMFVGKHGGQPLDVSYGREGQEFNTTIIPAHGVISGEAGRPALGLRLALISNNPLPLGEAATIALKTTWGSLKSVVVGLWTLITGAFHGSAHLEDVVGPVGLAGVVGDAAAHGFGYLLGLAAFISINLAVINLLPLPALDGGRLVLIAIEAVRRRATPHALVSLINAAGFALIILLMIVVTYHDIARLLM